MSNDGEVLSFAKSGAKPRTLKHVIWGEYHSVFLYENGKKQRAPVHRLVLLAWVGPPGENEECRHLNDDKHDNRLENLAWGSRQDNADDRVRNGHSPRGEKAGRAKLTEAQVIEIREKYAAGASSHELAKEYPVSANTIRLIAIGEKWKDLPVIERTVTPSCARKTPVSPEHMEKFAAGRKRYTDSIRKERKLVPCACGCGTMIVSVDSKGRSKQYVQGHNQRGKHWRWKRGED